MTYIDGFVIPLQKSKLAQYRRMARLGQEVWLDHGALDYKECVADDLSVAIPDGNKVRKVPSLFPKLFKTKRGETLVFSYIVYRSKAHRDRVNRNVFADPRMTGIDPSAMPVDMGRMATAGFRTIVEGRRGRPTVGRRTKRRTANRGARGRQALELAWPA